MFDTLLVPPAIGAPWTRAVTAALILHILLISAAIRRTASPPAGLPPVARDTIRLELADVRPSPLAPRALTSGPEPIVPAPPQVPDIDFGAPEFRRPPFSYRSIGPPPLNPDLPQRSRGAGAVPPDTNGSRRASRAADPTPSALSRRAAPRRRERGGAAAICGGE